MNGSVSLRCWCGNVGVCLAEPPSEVNKEDSSCSAAAIPLDIHRQLGGTANLNSAVHRVPELVWAYDVADGDPPTAKWRYYKCRICSVEVYACRMDHQGGGGQQTHPQAAGGEPPIGPQAALVNLNLLLDASAPAELAHSSGALLPNQGPASCSREGDQSTNVIKLLGASGAEGLKLFDRLTDEVDNWLSHHLKELAAAGSPCLSKEQEVQLRKKALVDRDSNFIKICQERGIITDLASLAQEAERVTTALHAGSPMLDAEIDDQHDGNWDEKYRDLSDFKARHGHCRVPRGWKDNVELSNWVRNLRRKKIRGTLALDKVEKLEALGFVWRKERKDSWEERFSQLVGFRERFGHCRVSRNWRENIKLGQWVQSLRRLKLSGRLGDDKISRLESIGFEWRLRLREDGAGLENGDGNEHVEPSDDDEEDEARPDADDESMDEDSAPETDSNSGRESTRLERWQPHTDGSTHALPTTTTPTTSGRPKTSKRAGSWLPRPPSFSLNDIDELNGGDEDDKGDGLNDDEEFDAEEDDDMEDDDDWSGGFKPNATRAKRKRATEKKIKKKKRANPRSRSSEQQPMSPATPPKRGVRACMQCGATKTPHWRRGPTDELGEPSFLCNACGLRYYKTLQKSPVKRKGSKKQKISRSESELRQEDTSEKRKSATAKASSPRRSKAATEAVTDSDSDQKEGDHNRGLSASREERKSARSPSGKGYKGSGTRDGVDLLSYYAERVEPLDGENTHVPWLLAFKHKRKSLMAMAAAAALEQPDMQPEGAIGEMKPESEEDETFDFVE